MVYKNYSYKPYTPGIRNRILISFFNINKIKPEKSLIKKLHQKKGRNNRGIITSRHRGGGHKRRYRFIDFKQIKKNIKSTVVSIQYDPNRNANIALLQDIDGEKRYILHCKNLNIGDTLDNSSLNIGNTLPLKKIPIGKSIHNIELFPKKGRQLARAAGVSAKILAKNNKYVTLKLPSKEIRLFNENCLATIGEVGNSAQNQIVSGKAGRIRWFGKRPTVRGAAMNPCDHPHGGGEGKAPIGRSYPSTPWGKNTLGVKTRKKKKSDFYIIKN
uniref:Large ribosomal subunit protein uL2m n=1 Tax=Nitzschia sp. NIES-3576 TaxID=2083273 RepID=A0A2Z5ZBJ9_9STRA|nr:ribosomal protein L2 [Nitzschia sp. NIES-3576]